MREFRENTRINTKNRKNTQIISECPGSIGSCEIVKRTQRERKEKQKVRDYRFVSKRSKL